jgi:hypothetical protein
MYITLMDFEWDPHKNLINLKKHQISFEEAVEIFSRPTFTFTDDQKAYGEVRKISIGQLQSQIVIVVVHATRQQHLRIISARPANSKERRAYYAYLKKASR